MLVASHRSWCGIATNTMVSTVEAKSNVLRQRKIMVVVDAASIQKQRSFSLPLVASLEFRKDAYSFRAARSSYVWRGARQGWGRFLSPEQDVWGTVRKSRHEWLRAVEERKKTNSIGPKHSIVNSSCCKIKRSLKNDANLPKLLQQRHNPKVHRRANKKLLLHHLRFFSCIGKPMWWTKSICKTTKSKQMSDDSILLLTNSRKKNQS